MILQRAAISAARFLRVHHNLNRAEARFLQSFGDMFADVFAKGEILAIASRINFTFGSFQPDAVFRAFGAIDDIKQVARAARINFNIVFQTAPQSLLKFGFP